MEVRLIGIDCATDARKIGVALGMLLDDRVVVHESRACTPSESGAEIVSKWLRQGPEGRVLLALDAPLGWPLGLSRALKEHRAGRLLSIEPNLMFRRATDRFVQAKLRKTPLEVGADRIARTAHSALQLLADLLERTSAPIPLAWSQDWNGIAAIEVYPAATLLAHGIPAIGYKKRPALTHRESMMRSPGALLTLPEDAHVLSESADALDAVICVLAGADFVRGRAYAPQDVESAAIEGWIWFASDAEKPPHSP